MLVGAKREHDERDLQALQQHPLESDRKGIAVKARELRASRARGDILIFLNNDTIVDDPDWLTVLVSYASQEGIGAVGAKLLYADRTVQPLLPHYQ